MSDRPPPRKGLLEVSRGRAFLTHLIASATVVGGACAIIFFVWYPPPYFMATGAWSVLRVLIGVDLGLGPLCTLIVFKPGKRGLKFDLAAIAVVQLAALVYGMASIYQGRPYFTVFAIDRFYVLERAAVDPAELARRAQVQPIGEKPIRGPLLVAASRPTDTAAMQRLLDETVFRGLPDIERRPEYWWPYTEQTARVASRAQPLAVLRAARPNSAAQIAALPARLGLPEERLGFLPLIARNRDLSFIVDRSSGAPLEVLDIDPWIGDPGVEATPGAPAAQP
jgi:hypothetical protein